MANDLQLLSTMDRIDRYPTQPFRAVLKKQVGKARIKQGRNESTTFCILDAQSIRNTKYATEKGDDAGKKVSGIKRHIAVDTQGLPHAVVITTANVTDRKGGLEALKQHKAHLTSVTAVLMDGSYTGQPFANELQNLLELKFK